MPFPTTQIATARVPDPVKLRTGVSVLAFTVIASVIVCVLALLLLRRTRHTLLGFGRSRARRKAQRHTDAWKESERRLQRDDDTVDMDPEEFDRG